MTAEGMDVRYAGSGSVTAERPMIAIAPRFEEAPPNPYVSDNRGTYEIAGSGLLKALLTAGALPVVMPVAIGPEEIDVYVDTFDGFLLQGGHDVNPKLWGDEGEYPQEMLCPERDAMESILVKKVVAAHKPLFTICRGTQLLNVAFGGSLNMDVYSREPREGMFTWHHTGILNWPGHPVEVEPDSLLEKCVGQRLIQTNSSHHCCVDRLAEGFVLVGHATDGMPEAIEKPDERFCLGVQWHPECTWEHISSDYALFESFVAAAREQREAARG